MAILNMKQILSADDLESQTMTIPEWGGEVIIRTMTEAERSKIEASVIQQNGSNQSVNMERYKVKVVVASLVDEEGKRLFTQKNIDALRQKSARPINRIVNAAQKLNGISDDDVEELMGNSNETEDGDSVSD